MHDVFISFSFTDQNKMEQIINQLLNRYNITYWVCTRDVRAGEMYDDKIYEAIKNAKVFVLIQSKKAVESEEIPKEIRLAIKFKKTIIPFIIEESEWEGGIAYQLSHTVESIDATKPTFDERIEDLANEIHLIIDKFNSSNTDNKAFNSKYSVRSRIPQPREVFYGREDEIAKINEHFLNGNRILFIEGIGGIGKSELAKQYAIQNRNAFDTIIYVTYDGSLQALVCSPDVFEIDGFSSLPNEDLNSFYKRKVKVLRSCLTEKSLVIVDNFDVNDDAEYQSFVEGRHNIIFTTRNTHINYPTIKIGPINDFDVALKIFEKNYGMPISEEDITYLHELFSTIEYHTYMIELFAKQMDAEFISASELLKKFKQGTLNETEIAIEGRTCIKTAFEHLSRLFSISKMSNDELTILRELSLMGLNGVPANKYWNWTVVFDSKKAITNLIKKSWVRKESKEGFIRLSLHPLVSEVIKSDKLNGPNVENTRGLLENIADSMYRTWYTPVKENISIVDCIINIAQFFMPFDFESNDKDLFEIWSLIPNFLWQVGRFDDAVYFAKKVYESALRVCGEKSMLTGFAAKLLAGVYFNSNQKSISKAWYEKALQSMIESQKENEDLAIAYEKVARCYTWSEYRDLTKSEEYFEKAIAIRYKLVDLLKNGEMFIPVHKRAVPTVEKILEGVGCVYFEKGRMYQLSGEYYKALECAQLFHDALMKYNSANRSSLAYTYYDTGSCMYHIGLQQRNDSNNECMDSFNRAKENLKKALEINTEMRGTVAIDTITNYELLADVYSELGEVSKALDYYNLVLKLYEDLLGKNCESSKEVKDKITKLPIL